MPAFLIAIAFCCEYVDSALGMGYGTVLTPVLLLFGYPATSVVAIVLFSEFLSGLIAGLVHHKLGNISLRRKSRDRRIVLVLASTGIFGTVAAVFTAVRIPAVVLKGYIGAMVLAMGIVVFLLRKASLRFSWARIFALGTVSAFNKGMSGGGYGPLVVSGQILSGHETKGAIGVTSMAEGLICAVGFSLYLVSQGGTAWFGENWRLCLPIVVGAVLAAPAAAWTTRWISKRIDLRIVVAVATSILGAWTLYKAFG